MNQNGHKVMKEKTTNHYDRKKELYTIIEGMIKSVPGGVKQNDIILAAMRATGFGERIIVQYLDYLLKADFIAFDNKGIVKWRGH
jgi:hypothetical protein|tara:strand:+ start:307 stop:561 length:255 start_codon:yes stop_codon:yes gene_type:complete